MVRKKPLFLDLLNLEFKNDNIWHLYQIFIEIVYKHVWILSLQWVLDMNIFGPWAQALSYLGFLDYKLVSAVMDKTYK